LKAQRQLCSLIACWCFVPIAAGCGRSRDPSGKYVSLIRLPGSGEEWTETIDFKRNGICYYGHPPAIAECLWSRRGNTITISRNGVVLNELQYDGKQLVDPQTAGVRGPYVQQK
jgi:hypothetical protein